MDIEQWKHRLELRSRFSECVCVCVYPISSALVFGMYQNILAEEASTQLYYVYTAPRIALRELVPVVGQSGSLLSWVMSC